MEEQQQADVTEGTAAEAGAVAVAAGDTKPARKPRQPKEPKKPAADAEAPAAEKHKVLVAKSTIVHGRGDKRFVFEAGQVVEGLSATEAETFLENGLVTETEV